MRRGFVFFNESFNMENSLFVYFRTKVCISLFSRLSVLALMVGQDLTYTGRMNANFSIRRENRVYGRKHLVIVLVGRKKNQFWIMRILLNKY